MALPLFKKQKKNSGSVIDISVLIIGIISVILFYYFIFRYSYNFPQLDDFDSPINAINQFEQSHFWHEKLKALFAFHDDHRLFFLRAISILHISIFGTLNFQNIVLFSNSFLILSLVILVQPIFRKKNIVYLIPAALFVFHPGYKDAILWAHVSSTYAPTLFFALFACYFSIYKKGLAPSFLACMASSLCFGNGVLSFISVALIWAMKQNWKTLLTWTALTLVYFSIYFTGHQGHQPSELSNIQSLINKLLGFWALSGSNFHLLTESITFTIILGFSVTTAAVVFIYKTFKKGFDKFNIFLLASLSFVLGTLAIIALARFNTEYSLDVLLANRYKFYSAFLFAILYIQMIRFYPLKKWSVGILTVFLFFSNAISYYKEKVHLDYRVKKLISSEFNWEKNKRGLIFYETQQDKAISYFETFEKQGYFDRNSIYNFDYLKETAINVDVSQKIIPREYGKLHFEQRIIEIVNPNDDLFFDERNGAYFILKSDFATYMFGAKQNKHSGKLIYKQGIGFSTEFDSEHIEPGLYQIYQLNLFDNSKKVIDTGSSIQI